jgi:hypothetical protein
MQKIYSIHDRTCLNRKMRLWKPFPKI